MSAAARFVDLSHPVVSGEPGYPGLPAPRIEPLITHAASRASYAGRASFEITRLFMVGSSGTYLDAPAHRHPGAADVAALALEAVAGLPAVVLDATTASGSRAIDVALPDGLAGTALLLRTGWDRRRGSPAYWRPGPFLPPGLAAALVAAGVALVGIDTWNIDDIDDPVRPAHTSLLGAGIGIVEQLRGLDLLPMAGARFFAVPPAVRGATSMPVRAFAELPASSAVADRTRGARRPRPGR